MLISNVFNDNNFELIKDGTILETHKHLVVHLSSNNKWSKHIDSIIESAPKQKSYLRKIKYQFSKQTLNTLSALIYDHFLNMLAKSGMVALMQTQID